MSARVLPIWSTPSNKPLTTAALYSSASCKKPFSLASITGSYLPSSISCKSTSVISSRALVITSMSSRFKSTAAAGLASGSTGIPSSSASSCSATISVAGLSTEGVSGAAASPCANCSDKDIAGAASSVTTVSATLASSKLTSSSANVKSTSLILSSAMFIPYCLFCTLANHRVMYLLVSHFFIFRKSSKF